jgi:hypothetical protein
LGAPLHIAFRAPIFLFEFNNMEGGDLMSHCTMPLAAPKASVRFGALFA